MLTVTINGRAYGPRDVRDELTMNDFLREYLGMTGTKFGCGAAQCLSCAIIVDNPDGTSYTSPTCIVPATSFNGKWNLGQYVVPRGSDLPLNGLEIEILPPVDADERPKGIAEVVMMPAAPALLNAIYDATGHRFQSLTVTQAMIKGVLK